jgi:hypothetical protein
MKQMSVSHVSVEMQYEETNLTNALKFRTTTLKIV